MIRSNAGLIVSSSQKWYRVSLSDDATGLSGCAETAAGEREFAMEL